MDNNSPRSVNTEEEFQELFAALEERDRHIEHLERQLEQGNNTGTFAVQEENDRLTSELEKHRDELISTRNACAELQQQVKHIQEDNQELAEANEQLEGDVEAHRRQIDALRSQLNQWSKASEELKKLRKDTNQQHQRLELENHRLREAVRDLEGNEDVLCSEVDKLAEEKSEYQQRNEELSAKCDSLYAELDEKTKVNADLIEERDILQKDLEKEKAVHAKAEAEWAKRDTDYRLKTSKLEEALELERSKESNKELEASKIALAEFKHEHRHLLRVHEQCLIDKNQAEQDLDSTIKALNEYKSNVKEELAQVSRKEHSVSAELKRQLIRADQKEKSIALRCNDLEQQLEDVPKRLENSEQRNSKYERNHGLSEAVRYQKKLEADLLRRDYDIKQVNQKLSLEIEHRRALQKAVSLLKERVDGNSSDFELDDEDIQAALKREDNALQSENNELVRQVEHLEGNNDVCDDFVPDLIHSQSILTPS